MKMKFLTKIVLAFFVASGFIQNYSMSRTAAAFSVGDEKKVGEQLLTMVRKEFKLLDELDIQQYIDGLGQSTIDVAGSQFFEYHFFVINNRELNAFAAPSGLIFFHSGLIESLDSEDELVGVVAHEVGHVVSRHLASRMSKTAKISAATMLGVLAGIALGSGALSEALIVGSAAAAQSASLSFSRLDEEEADRLAFNWMQDQKRDPEAMVDMLRKIHTMNRYRQGYIPPYLLTHPGPDIRMSYIQDLTLFSPKKPYVRHDEFVFQRFKSRVICLTKEPMQLIQSYQAAVAFKEPGSMEAAMDHYVLSQAYLAAADYDRAEKELRLTMSAYPDMNILKTDLGIVFLKAGRYQAALSQLQDAEKNQRGDAYATFYLAQALEKNGRLQEAADLFEKMLGVIPDYSQLYYQLANLNGRIDRKGEGFFYYGFYYFYEGDFGNAKNYFTKAVSILPQDSRMRTDAQNMLDKIDRFEKEGPL